MSQSQRQSELFAGQDWTIAYRAFTEVNLNAFDFDTIRAAMTDYVRRNYPEDFNDWIESTELVVIIDLLAYLGQSLAFRMDLNARENFMDVAQARESILRLARFLSYSPKRNYPARGLVKVTEIRCTQDLYDSQGSNLNNAVIRWDDPNNPNWFEQFVLVLNACLITTNPFGTPLQADVVNGVNTQLYRIENVPFTAGNLPFNSGVNGSSLNFDVINVDFSAKRGFFERSPDPQAAVHLIYRNDGNGNSSASTGFFLYFKQGNLARQDIQISEPVENRMIDLDILNINESDVWVQSVDDNGNVLVEWTRVGYVPSDDISKIVVSSDNVTYNSLPISVQDIYQTVTRDQDRISVRFGDGRFGTIPVGNLRVWYRQSAGEYSSIRPDDMRNVTVSMPYQNKDLKQSALFLTFSLQETIINASPAESNDDIRRRAGAMYATQGRMVSGDDYNAMPATNNLALKTKAINRVYSGHSRYIDLNDPTGTYQNTNVFADDGALFRELHNQYREVPHSGSESGQELFTAVIAPLVANQEMRDFLFDEWLLGAVKSAEYNFQYSSTSLWWDQSTNVIYSSTGRFSRATALPGPDSEWDAGAATLGRYSLPNTPELYLLPGSLIKFRDAGWVSVSNIVGKGDGFKASGEGYVRLNEDVQRGDRVLRVLPNFRRVLNDAETTDLLRRIDAQRSFAMGFDFRLQQWYFMDAGQVGPGYYNYSTKNSYQDTSWLIRCDYNVLNWRITSRGIRHVFESQRDVKFFYAGQYKTINSDTGLVAQDRISILSNNVNPRLSDAQLWRPNTTYEPGAIIKLSRGDAQFNDPTADFNYYECMRAHESPLEFATGLALLDTSTGTARALLVEAWRMVSPGLLRDYQWSLADTYKYDDGYVEARRVLVGFFDTDYDGQPDNPESFGDVVQGDSWVIHQRYRDLNGYEYYRIFADMRIFRSDQTLPVLNPQEVIFVFAQGQEDGVFYRCHLTEPGVPVLGRSKEISPLADQSDYQANRGRRDIRFQWKHYAPVDHRIDPAVTNIIDVFVLTREYHTQVQQWLRGGSKPLLRPRAPTELQLKIAYQDLEQYKMFSDQIVWRPVKYKFLFGATADSQLRARFKIVKLPNTSASDGEIKSRVVTAIQNFFDVNSWDFGETFYFSELGAYVHKQLLNAISSVMIVPLADDQSFGDLIEIHCLPDEIFFPTATVSDIEIIPANTQTSLRIR